MNQKKLDHFQQKLRRELREHSDNVRGDQIDALQSMDDGVKDSLDMSVVDHNRELALRLGERESQMIADIDQALLRIEEGSYGTCARCGKVIDERRLEAMPTARYDAVCQTEIEREEMDEMPTL